MTSTRNAVFAGGIRTPFCRSIKGTYKDIRPDDLLISLLSQQISRHPSLNAQGADDLIVGCAYPEGEQGYNVARMTALGCGLEIPIGFVPAAWKPFQSPQVV